MIFCTLLQKKQRITYLSGPENCYTTGKAFHLAFQKLWICVYKSQYKFSLKQDKYVAVLYKNKNFICRSFRNPCPMPYKEN